MVSCLKSFHTLQRKEMFEKAQIYEWWQNPVPSLPPRNKTLPRSVKYYAIADIYIFCVLLRFWLISLLCFMYFVCDCKLTFACFWLQIIRVLTVIYRVYQARLPEHFGIYSQVNRTNKICFLDWAGKNPNLTQLPPPKFRYFPNHNRPKGDLMKMNFKNFQIEKCDSETVRR